MKKHTTNALFTAAFILLSSFGAIAAELGDDEVTLKNGGSIRGTVVSVEPGTKVVIVEAGSDAPRTIPWGEVADVEKGKYKKADAQPGPGGPGYTTPPPKPQEEPVAGGKGVVNVHIETTKPVQLVEELGTSYATAGAYVVAVGHARVACTSPCDKAIDASRGQAFFVGGDGVPKSERFYLNDRQGDVTVKVDPGSTGQRGGGIAMVSVGGAGAVAGVLMLVLGATLSSVDTSTEYDPDTGEFVESKDDSSSPLIPAGGIAIGIGAGLIVGGIVLIATGKTSVEVSKATQGATASRPRAVEPRYWLGEF